MFSTSVSWHTLARGIPKPHPLGWALDVNSVGSYHLVAHCSKMALQMSVCTDTCAGAVPTVV